MGGLKATMALQDAPYNVRIKGYVSGLGKVHHREFTMASGEIPASEFQQFNATNLKAITSDLIDGAVLGMFMDWGIVSVAVSRIYLSAAPRLVR